MNKGLMFLGITMMGYAVAPTPDDITYLAGGAGAVKDAGLFLAGLALAIYGATQKGG